MGKQTAVIIERQFVDVEHVVAFVREQYRARDEQSRREEALATGNV